jgi:hypothetical protein
LVIDDVQVTVNGEVITEDPHDNPVKSIRVLSHCKHHKPWHHSLFKFRHHQRPHGHHAPRKVLRLIPEEGESILIQADKQTTVESPFDPNEDIVTLKEGTINTCERHHRSHSRWGGHHAGCDTHSRCNDRDHGCHCRTLELLKLGLKSNLHSAVRRAGFSDFWGGFGESSEARYA